MNNRVEARIAAIAEAIRRKQMEQALPVDGLSHSMVEVYKEIGSMTAADLHGLLTEDGSPILTLAEAEKMISDFRKENNG